LWHDAPVVKRSLWSAIVALVVAAVAVAAVLIWAPVGVRGWLAGVLAAAVAAYLAQDVPRRIGDVRSRWRQRDGSPPGVAVTAKIVDVDYVEIEEDGRLVSVPASGHGVRLIVESTGPALLLTGAQVEVVSRRPATGSLARHAGAVPVRRFEIRLDEQPPTVRALGTDFPFQVAPGDPEVLELCAFTEVGDVSWVLNLDWVCAGVSGTARIDAGGRPFRTMAREPMTQLT
jgi:hypothetical protein